MRVCVSEQKQSNDKEAHTMKKFRKGFTLVELLVVIAILGALAAAMSTSVTGATAKAKAATIANNVAACITAARLYAINNVETDLTATTADTVLFASLPSWKDYSTGNIKYENVTTGKGIDGWAITVDFGGDPEKDAIATELSSIKGFSKSYTGPTDATGTAIVSAASGTGASATPGSYKFKVTLSSGKIEASL